MRFALCIALLALACGSPKPTSDTQDPLAGNSYERSIGLTWATRANAPTDATQAVSRVFREDGTYRIEVRMLAPVVLNVRADGMYAWAEGEYQLLHYDADHDLYQYRLWQLRGEEWDLRERAMLPIEVQRIDIEVVAHPDNGLIQIGSNYYTEADSE